MDELKENPQPLELIEIVHMTYKIVLKMQFYYCSVPTISNYVITKYFPVQALLLKTRASFEIGTYTLYLQTNNSRAYEICLLI